MSDQSRRKATIRRATRRAQRHMNRYDRETLGRLEGIYRSASERIADEITARGGPDGRLNLEVLGDLKRQIDGRLGQLISAQSDLMDEALQRSAQLGASPLESEITGGRISRAANDAVEFVREFVDNDGIQLSDRIWRLERNARDAVGRAVESAVIQGHSASRAAQDFLARGDTVPDGVRRQLERAGAERVARSAGQALMRDEGNAYADARRVMRTEINRAHGTAYRKSAEHVDDVIGMRFLLSPRHPRRDICDMHASVNRYGLGAGVYPPGRSPWPAHPNTLSYEEVVFADEVTAAERDARQDRIQWLKQQPPDVQEAVLNSRRKRAALERGLLGEGQIATPWRTLRDRFARQGVDVESLRPAPLQAQRFRRAGQPITREAAERHVLDQGRESGVEHAVMRDTASGTEMLRKTSNLPDAVQFTQRELVPLQDPSRRVELVHNHPNSSSLSLPDFGFSTQPGVERIVAVGHDGSVYSGVAATDVTTLKRAHARALDAVLRGLQRRVNERAIGVDDANRAVPHLTNSALARSGVVRYEMEKAGDIMAPALRRLGNLDDIIQAAAGELGDGE